MNALALTRRSTSIWGVLAILAALGTGVAVYSYLSWLRSQVPVSGKLVPMVVAARDLEPGTSLEESMLKIVQHPQPYLPSGAVSDEAKVVGQVLTVPVLEGEPITTRKVGRSGGFSSLIPPGTRAYSLSISSGSGLGFLPKPGDRVDVIVTFPQEVLGEATSMTILQGKEIAAVTTPSESRGREVAGRLGIDAVTDSGISLTLFVTPVEAERLAMAESLGKITIVLAPAGAESEPVPNPVTPRDLGSG